MGKLEEEAGSYMDSIIGLARGVFEKPAFAAILYAGAVVAVFATMGQREEE